MNAQNITDGLRYSAEDIFGTARFNAMGGAFGALGGDLSAIGVNPAGSAIFLDNSAAVSLSIFANANTTRYGDGRAERNRTDLDFNQAGVVYVYNIHKENTAWNKVTLGFNYDTQKSFYNDVAGWGTSDLSIGDYFQYYAQGIPLDLLELRAGEGISDLYGYLGGEEGFGAQQAFLGYQGYLIDPIDLEDPNNTAYVSNTGPGDFEHRFSNYTSGRHAKLTFNIGAQLYEDLFLGLNLNSHVIDFGQAHSFREDNAHPNAYITRVEFDNELRVLGNGFSAQLGGILRASDQLRLGLTYSTPTWFGIDEETRQWLSTGRVEEDGPVTTNVYPNVTNVYARYRLRTPGKLSASAAWIFDRYGLLSIDYSFRDFSNMRFSPGGDPHFKEQNALIGDELKGVSTVRIGGEYRLAGWRLRGGLRFEESPYKNEDRMSSLTGFSAGLGYSFGHFSIDAAYARFNQETDQQLYPGEGFTNTAGYDTTSNVVTLSFGFSL